MRDEQNPKGGVNGQKWVTFQPEIQLPMIITSLTTSIIALGLPLANPSVFFLIQPISEGCQVRMKIFGAFPRCQEIPREVNISHWQEYPIVT